MTEIEKEWLASDSPPRIGDKIRNADGKKFLVVGKRPVLYIIRLKEID